nr:crotonase/enoyl-CoA hydratase family protein [Oceanococcus sp. HetDA_MAG_MS8]
MSEPLVVQRDGAVAEVHLHRPDKHNALDWPLFEALVHTGRELAADRSLRAVVLCGDGPSFCSGLDYPAMMQQPDAFKQGFSRAEGAQANFVQEAAWVWKQMPVPVLCAIHGACFGGGIQIALAADLRFATPDARLSVMEIKWGLIPDVTGTATLRELVRLDVAKDLTYSGRIVSGEEALTLGLVTRLETDPLAAARAYAADLCQKNPEALRLGKQLLDANWNEPDASTVLAREQELQLKLLGSKNQQEAAKAALTKTLPDFDDSRF